MGLKGKVGGFLKRHKGKIFLVISAASGAAAAGTSVGQAVIEAILSLL